MSEATSRTVSGDTIAAQVDVWEAQLAAQTSDDAFLDAWSEVLSGIRGHAATDVDGLEGRLAPFQRRYLAISEGREAEHLLSIDARSNGTLASQARAGFGRSVFDRLADLPGLVDLNRCRRVVVVGCGALPAAAFVIHDGTTDTHVSALEIDPATAEVAQRVVARHGSPRLEVLAQDGREHDFNEANVVFVANQVTPKAEVLARIASTAPVDVAVVLREPAGVGLLLSEPLGQLPAPWRVVANGPTDQRFLSYDVLLGHSA